MTQADWVKEKLEERFPFGVYTDIDTDVTDETVELIQKIITLAQQRTEKKWREPVEDKDLVSDPQARAINMVFNSMGTVEKRRGWRYFGDMVHELWRINKIAQKSGFSSDITVRIPLPGRKPIFKKTLEE